MLVLYVIMVSLHGDLVVDWKYSHAATNRLVSRPLMRSLCMSQFLVYVLLLHRFNPDSK